jgi:hypothetical protein
VVTPEPPKPEPPPQPPVVRTIPHHSRPPTPPVKPDAGVAKPNNDDMGGRL